MRERHCKLQIAGQKGGRGSNGCGRSSTMAAATAAAAAAAVATW